MAETKATAEAKPGRADETRTTEGRTTKRWPQVGDPIRFHAGPASGWKVGKVLFERDGAIVLEMENGQSTGRNKGEYEPADGNLPIDRHLADATPADMIQPVIGPAGPVMVPAGAGPAGMSAGAGQTLPTQRHLVDTGTGTATDDKDLKENSGPSFTAGPPPPAGAYPQTTGARSSHPTREEQARMDAEREEQRKKDAENAKAGAATGKKV